jgi:hypothetical protein
LYCFVDFITHTQYKVFFPLIALDTQITVKGKYAISSSQNLFPNSESVTDCTTEETGFDSWRKQEFFLLFIASRPALGSTHPPIQLVPGVVSLMVKRCEDDPPYSGSSTSTSHRYLQRSA